MERVFVYGTLKRGMVYFPLVQMAGLVGVAPARIQGYDLYHLEPEGYPAVVPGTGSVTGELHLLRGSLRLLDSLEGTGMDPPLYRRRPCRLDTGGEAWIYLFDRPERLLHPSARRVPRGIWEPLSDRKRDSLGS